MQYQLTINIPDYLSDYIRSIENFEQFVNNAILEALRKPDATQRKQRLAETAKLMAPECTVDTKIESLSPQVKFMCLPLNERRRILAEQAQQMVVHYE